MRFKRKLSHRIKRFGAWLKQVVLLGRADWHKASDDVNPPRLTQSQRAQLQPEFDVNAIKPRTVAAAVRESPASEPALIESEVAVTPEVLADPTRVRRRRRRSQHNAVNPLTAFTPEKLPTSKAAMMVEKFFGWRR